MNKIFKSVLVGAAAASMAFLGTGAATAAPVGTGGATPNIVGGTQAPATPWAVQLTFQLQGQSGTFGCTGEAISKDYILTANHCIEGISAMNVYYSNSTANRGTAIKADDWSTSGEGDVALVHLSSSKELGSYPALADSYTADSSDSGVIMGYGLRANKVRPDGLYQANVDVLGSSRDAFDGTAVHVQGVDGAANHGDSGGPLLIGGKIVGVCSTGDSSDPGADIHAGSNYANLTASRSWIKSVSGV